MAIIRKAKTDASMVLPTMAFQLPEVRTDTMSPLPATSSKVLTALKDKLSSCSVRLDAQENEVNSTGAIIKNVVKNMRAAELVVVPHVQLRSGGRLEPKDVKFFLAQTRSQIFLIYDVPPEALYEDARFMHIDFKRRAILTTVTNKTLYVSRIMPSEQEALLRLAAQPNTGPIEKLALDENSSMLVDIQQLALKLRGSSRVNSSDTAFNMRTFVESMKFGAVVKDGDDNKHYFIVAGNDENSYRLYVNIDRPAPPGCLSVTKFMHGNESCTLFRET